MELNNLYCQNENHNNGKVIGFCIDDNCPAQNRFACAECFFDIHPQHKLMRIQDLNQLINNRYKDYMNYLEEEKLLLMEIYKKNEPKHLQKVEEFKKKLIKEIEIKINDFMDELKKELKQKYENMALNQGKNDFDNIREFESFFNNNIDLNTKLELSNLSKICLNLIKEGNNKKILLDKKKQKEKEISIPSDNEKIIIKKNYILDCYNKEIDFLLKNKSSLISKYLEEALLKLPDNIFNNFNFEWCNKTYGGYNFLYKLSNNNQKGTKINSNGTMSILRSKEELKNNYKYNIKFKIGIKYKGDFDIGIGTEKAGENHWLRTKDSICISNEGIMNQSLCMDDSFELKDNDIIDLEISTKEGNKYFKASLNGKLICIIDFDFNNIYIMAAMRNTGNFIEVIEYNSSYIC